MKNSIVAALVLSVAFAVTAAAQVNPAISAVNSPVSRSIAANPEAPSDPAKATRARVLNQTQKSPITNSPTGNAQSLQAHAKANFKNRARLDSLPAEVSTSDNTQLRTVTSSSGAVAEPNAVTNKKVVTPNIDSIANVRTSATLTAAPSQIYRVGVGDVLDIQLNNNSSQESTLFTVLNGGMLEYPLAGSPVRVTGMTASEIATTLRTKIKLFENPAVLVNVRDYASHTVTISGFVGAPGTKTLRREAVPLYALLAESLVLPDAAFATVARATGTVSLALNDPNLSATLILPGDVIKVLGPAAATEFFFVAGEVKLPGQKAYHSGLTLTQAILAAGGATNTTAERVRVSRQGTDGRLVTEEFNLRKILDGKLADPLLHKDDRIELTAAN